MKAKKLLSAIIALAMIASMVSVGAYAADAADVWDGVTATTEWFDNSQSTTEYYLNSASDLAGLAKIVNTWSTTTNPFLGATIYLNVDVDLNNKDWAPIGTAVPGEKNRFYGSFNGQGHTISNLKVAEGHYYAGLFGVIPTYDYSQVFSNLTFCNVSSAAADDAASKEAAGVLIGRANGCVVDNCHVIGEISVSGDRFVGGLLGHSYAQISDCSVKASGSIAATTWQAGGLVGVQGASDKYASSVENCSVIGDSANGGIEVKSYYAAVGGAIGTVALSNVDSTVVDGIAVANVSVSAENSDSGSGIAYVACGYAATESVADNVTATFAGEEYIATDSETIGAPVAKVGDDVFASVTDAIDAAAKIASEQTPAIVEIAEGEFTLDTYKLPNMEYVTIKGAADKKTVIKDTVLTNLGNKTDNITNLTFDGIVFENSRIYINGWTAGMNFADWTITNCEFNNLYSATSVGGVVQFNLSSGMVVGDYGPWADVALDGFTFTYNVIDGADCNGVCSAINSQAMEGTIIIENNVFKNIDFNAIQLQNVPETATVSIKNNTISAVGSSLMNLNNNLAYTAVYKNVLIAADESQYYISNASAEIDASANFFGIGTCVEDAVFNENYAASMHVKSGVEAPAVLSYYTDAELTEEVNLAAAQIEDKKFLTLSDAIEKAGEGDTITLVDDVIIEDVLLYENRNSSTWNGSYAFDFRIGKELTLDLNGKTIKSVGGSDVQHYAIFCVDGNGNLTITDSSEEKTGAIINAAASTPAGKMSVVIYNEAAELTVSGGALSNQARVNGNYPYVIDSITAGDAKLTITEGATISADGYMAIRTMSQGGSGTQTVNITGGKIEGGIWAVLKNGVSDILNFTISGGDFYGDNAFIVENYAEPAAESGVDTISIIGGNFYGTVAIGENNVASLLSEGFISGGVFSNDVSEYVVEPYVINRVSEKVYKVVEDIDYTLTFEVNDGNEIAPVTMLNGSEIKLSKYNATRSGYKFSGWYTDAECTDGNEIDIVVLDADKTVYAKWTKYSGNSGGLQAGGDTSRNGADDYAQSDKEDDNEEDSDKTEEQTPVTPVTPAAHPFADVNESHWFDDAVEYVYTNGLMNGTSANTFSPNGELTRAMLVTILYRVEGSPEVSGTASFGDVASGSYYEKAVIWAKENGIVNGYTETMFCPDIAILREQIAAIIYRYASYKGYDVSAGESTNILSYNDHEDISEYAIGAMQYAVGSGLLNGKTEATLNSQDNATRAEMATILQRFIEAHK